MEVRLLRGFGRGSKGRGGGDLANLALVDLAKDPAVWF